MLTQHPPLRAVYPHIPGSEFHPSNAPAAYLNSLLRVPDKAVLLVDSDDVVRLANNDALALLDGLVDFVLGEPLVAALPRSLSRHEECNHSVLEADIGNDFVTKLVGHGVTTSCIGVTLKRRNDPYLGLVTLVFLRKLSDGYANESLGTALEDADYFLAKRPT